MKTPRIPRLWKQHKAMDVNVDGLVGTPLDEMPKQDPTGE